MDYNSIVDIVKRVLADITNDEAVLSMGPHTLLKEELGIDSMTSLTFLMALEESVDGFVVDADTLEPEHFNTIGTICDYVFSQLKIHHAAQKNAPV